MEEYNGICWMGWVIIIIYFLVCCGVFWLLFGSNAIYWIFGLILCTICGIIRGVEKKKPVVRQREVPTFTDEDFMYCKVGEWVSK